ncbi:MAG: bifunctional proline dehydrogenase/L-glutamate gamma-semialdehyde dehydrogenase PutA [Rudaea sp.]|uniref:bifunctional proline dehydrogenase/L-glutamate gamma-semialdehyde dehydrogenase PutA n=1 Tax=unclassified Rudaea TaxID=2627037 RepID=UPI0010F4C8A4|nr:MULTISPECIES: bifunctional proline dehydrogenase/L-glutamate gamma-semialdehyde dehydrogenase PutA [unclassified Rudaea]MBN8886982.1 bifunctional proline dehydrogenase/L-glutamate gamma-semialdehyde dehydrogenase PutA [Rudaea sp.]MBR0347634.1 bifunctional proline dehydrogenase/L-glutamate gamma-semialdehyde dehydrogenase PutA [Rudaea sp.]
MLSPELPPAPDAAHALMTAAYCRDETEAMNELLGQAALPAAERDLVLARATELVARVRAKAQDATAVEAFMRQYDLSSEEGVLLMCVAEALLRIPDKDTADKLISDKLGEANWEAHLGKSDSLFVNAGTWGLMLTGKFISLAEETQHNFTGALKRLVGRAGEPVIRLAVRQAMRIMGHQFVMGRTIKEGLDRAQEKENRAYRYSYDMLGEGALTTPDGERYYRAYVDAIKALGARGPFKDILDAPSISIKLSALHPRYEVAKRARVHAELAPKLLALAQLAKAQGICLTVDAEEADRLELSLDLIAAVHADPSLDGYQGFGLAVQAYQKRAPFVIDWLAEQAKKSGKRFCVRLVKGAYWDSEIKRAQEGGHAGYPVYTRKPNTDVSYLACAKRLFEHGQAAFYPAFATHNAHTIAAIHHIAQGRPFEFQRLHGMGADLYNEVIGENNLNVPCRVYAPVGSHEDLLPYLVRRLLENGANTSFVNRIVDESTPIKDLVADPVDVVRGFASKPHPRIPQPIGLFGEQRKNSMGVNFGNDNELKALADAVGTARADWNATPLVPGAKSAEPLQDVTNPADRRQKIGTMQHADAATIDRSLVNAVAAQPAWDALPAASRAKILEHAADLLEQRRASFVALLVREAGKTLPAAISEVREAADMCRYYAAIARKLFQPENLPGPTGESNQLSLHGRGVFVCISPWNFPLAIFTGQVAAALATGNAVIAKPADQTVLIGHAAVKLLHEAGVPEGVLQFLPGRGSMIGNALLTKPDIAGVCMTGSTETAWTINRTLAARNAQIAALIAETGGQNALIADSSALPEQLVKDVVASAFDSAGQRCSAARVLFVQEDIADKVIHMLAGAMDELKVGDPGLLSTDVGPVIDEPSRKNLADHAARMDQEAKLIKQVALPAEAQNGTFLAPRAYELKSLSQLTKEVFGPILHVIRWKSDQLDQVIDAINATGFGLTLGIHSRIDSTIAHIAQRAKVGNCYVNRNQIGAVVGVQPFGGEGLSGTGPKAGGPHYLTRFVTERTLTINTTAAGGNASLLTLGE